MVNVPAPPGPKPVMWHLLQAKKCQNQPCSSLLSQRGDENVDQTFSKEHGLILLQCGAFQVARVVKKLPAITGYIKDAVLIPG